MEKLMKILTCHKQQYTQILKCWNDENTHVSQTAMYSNIEILPSPLRSAFAKISQRAEIGILEYIGKLENNEHWKLENWNLSIPTQISFLKISQRAENRQDFRLKVQVISNSTIDFGNAASSKTRILYAVIHKQDMLHAYWDNYLLFWSRLFLRFLAITETIVLIGHHFCIFFSLCDYYFVQMEIPDWENFDLRRTCPLLQLSAASSNKYVLTKNVYDATINYSG